MIVSNDQGPIAEITFHRESEDGHWWVDSLYRYWKYGINPGHFLIAVLSNDLFGAWSRADEFCKADMDLIVKFVYNKLPGDCWGDKERVLTWTGL
jgi:hypothetical protein